jgi:hypothetical protein
MGCIQRTKKYPLLERSLAAFGCFMTLTATIVWLIVGLNSLAAVSLLAALGALLVPQTIHGSDGVLEFLLGVLERAIDGLTLMWEAIASLFSGLG